MIVNRIVPGLGINVQPQVHEWDRPTVSGVVYYNAGARSFTVCDGMNTAIMKENPVMVGLDMEAAELIQWAKRKREEEALILEKLARNPELKSVVDQLELVKTILANTPV